MSAEVLIEQALAFVRRSLTKTEAATVELYGGQFSAEEIPQKSYNCPAIFITVLGWQAPPAGSRLTGRHAKQYRLCAFVAFKHADRVKRMSGGLVLAEKLGVLLRQWAPMQELGNAQLAATIGGLDDEARCENLYNRAVDKAGQSLFALSWYQCAKPAVPLGPTRPAVPYAQLPNMATVEITDNTHVNQVPAVAAPVETPPVVTEAINFINP
jgi:phage gp37-like protein